MPVFACTMFLEIDSQKTGWSETWYRNFADSQAAVTAYRAVAAARANTMGEGGKVVKIRVSDVNIAGDSSEGRDPAWVGPNESVAFGSVGFLQRYEANDLSRCQRILRGLPRNAFLNDSPREINGAGPRQQVDLFNAAILNAYSFRVKRRPPAVAEFAVKGILADPPNALLTYETMQPHNIQPGQYINALGLRDFVKETRGIHWVRSVGPTFVSVPLPANLVTVVLNVPYNGKGKLRVVDFDYPIVSRIIPQRWTDRQSGRPFDLQVGRA